MRLPGPLRDDVTDWLRSRDRSATIDDVHPVSGGCVHQGCRVTSGGRAYFLKWNRHVPSGMFEAESAGLSALAASGALHVPRVFASGTASGELGWLLMEFIPPEAPDAEYGALLGAGLAELHGQTPPPFGSDGQARFGWDSDNWIGSLPQDNTPEADWGIFWQTRRIEPQLEHARHRGHLRDTAWEVLVNLIPDMLDHDPAPALLHGDLWSGNCYPGPNGPVLIDPAVYVGDREVDLAMMHLFGGFGAEVFAAYRESELVSGDPAQERRDLYQLYYLLVHVNLFGGSYVRSTEALRQRILDRAH
jgi:fructosamine-3-kinase